MKAIFINKTKILFLVCISLCHDHHLLQQDHDQTQRKVSLWQTWIKVVKLYISMLDKRYSILFLIFLKVSPEKARGRSSHKANQPNVDCDGGHIWNKLVSDKLDKSVCRLHGFRYIFLCTFSSFLFYLFRLLVPLLCDILPVSCHSHVIHLLQPFPIRLA